MIKLIALVAIIIGAAYYWWIAALAFAALLGWSLFDINRKPKKKKDAKVIHFDENSYS